MMGGGRQGKQEHGEGLAFDQLQWWKARFRNNTEGAHFTAIQSKGESQANGAG